MGIFSVRKDSHPTFWKPWFPKRVKLLLLWLVYYVRVSPGLFFPESFSQKSCGFFLPDPRF